MHNNIFHAVKRNVTLKTTKPGMDYRQVLDHLEAEGEALAMLDHSDMAHLYDATTPQEADGTCGSE